MHNPAKTPQFWIICFALIANTLWLQAQSFDTLVLRNVEKKYLIGKVLSIQSDYVVYFRHNLPNGPEFRMNKQNVRWIITSSNEIIEVSESFNPTYRFTDSTTKAQPALNQTGKAPTGAPESTQEYYTRPSPRTVITEQQQQSNRVAVMPEKNRYKAPVKNDFFTISFMLGASSQRWTNFPALSVNPGVSSGLELGYIGFRDKIYLNPSVRFHIKNYRLKYPIIDSAVNLNVKERQGLVYFDLSLAIGYVLGESNGLRTVVFIGPYYGALLGGSYEAEITGTVRGRSFIGEAKGGIEPGEFDPNVQSDQQYLRPFEIGLYAGFRFSASDRILIGPDVKYGITDIAPRLKNVGTVFGKLPEVRASSFHLTMAFLF